MVISTLIILTLFSVLVFPVSAEKSKIVSFYEEMGGKEISAGEYLEVIDPYNFFNLTKEQKENYYSLMVTVPDLSDDKGKNTAVDTATGSSQEKTAIVYTTTAYVDLAPIPLGINWLGNTHASAYYPEMHVTASLLYSEDGDSWEEVSSGSDHGYFTNFVEVLEVEWLPSEGYYKVISNHWGDYPAGAFPAVYSLAPTSGTMYYSG